MAKLFVMATMNSCLFSRSKISVKLCLLLTLQPRSLVSEEEVECLQCNGSISNANTNGDSTIVL